MFYKDERLASFHRRSNLYARQELGFDIGLQVLCGRIHAGAGKLLRAFFTGSGRDDEYSRYDLGGWLTTTGSSW